MAMPQATVTFDVHDAKIFPMLTDNLGEEPTYDTGIDVPGINNVSVEPELISAVLKGDARTLDRRARIDSFNFSVGYSLLSLEVLGVLWNATVTEEAGTSDARVLEVSGGGSLPYFKFGFTILDGSQGIGSINVYGLKTQVTGTNAFEQSTESYGGRSFQVAAIPTLSTNKMFRTELWPVVTPLAAS